MFSLRLLSLALAFATNTVLAATCTENGIELSTNSTNPANPLFLNPHTGQTFQKYSTDTGTASETEMNTIEYLCSYNVDKEGIVWLVHNASQAVARMTHLYTQEFAGKLDITPRNITYEHDVETFQQLLQRARADPQLQAEARAWIEDVKWTPSKEAEMEKETRRLRPRLYSCSVPYYCYSGTDCVNDYGSAYCRICTNNQCYFAPSPMPDGC